MSQNKEPEPTRLESADEILQALAARRKRQPVGPASRSAEAQRDRPLQRPPMALLCICDDGKQEGEWVRVRADRTLIGRTDGDIRIPHDVQMSAQHAEIVREPAGTGWRWVLRDAGSTNGSFVRISNTILRNGNELIVGMGRYRFESAIPSGAVADAAGAGRALTPSLVEFTSAGPIQRFLLTLPEYWIGREPGPGGIVRPDDPFVDGQHARFYRDKNGQRKRSESVPCTDERSEIIWYVANNASLNGLWLRIKSITLDRGCQFRLGEQRFLFRVGE